MLISIPACWERKPDTDEVRQERRSPSPSLHQLRSTTFSTSMFYLNMEWDKRTQLFALNLVISRNTLT